MKRLMLAHAFRVVERVAFLVDPRNFRSQRAVEKTGAVLSGTRRDGSDREVRIFAITADRFGAS